MSHRQGLPLALGGRCHLGLHDSALAIVDDLAILPQAPVASHGVVVVSAVPVGGILVMEEH